MPITLEPCESSAIRARGYDPDTRVLAVEFKSGSIVHYLDAPADLWAEFLEALSIGQFYAMNIKGKYQAVPMTGPCGKCGAHGPIGETCTDCGCDTYHRTERRYGEPTGGAGERPRT